jgi:beta-N-acetylhexosaminidase
MAVKDSFRALLRPNYRRRRLVAVLGVLAVGAGVASALLLPGGSKHSALPRPAQVSTGAATTVQARGGPALPRGVSDLMRRMTVERKVAQLLLVGFDGTGPGAPVFGDMTRLDIGGLVIGSGNFGGRPQLERLTAFAEQVAKRRGHVAPWLLTIQDGGGASQLAGLPPTHSPSGLSSLQRAASEASAAARALHALGINGVLGPDVDVDTPTGGAYTDLSYSSDPAQVARFAAITVRAYAREKMLTAPKHFPGLGAASQPTDQGVAEVGLTLNQLARRDLVPFKTAIDAGARGIVLGHGLYTTDSFATPASESPALINQLLRANLRFLGIAITDDLESPAITDNQKVPAAAVAAIKAGADMVFISGPRTDELAAYQALLGAVQHGQIPAARLDASVERILLAKRALGLIP